jgi:hypothetical protein
LSAKNLRQIRERIGAKAALTPLSPAESAEYVDFRLQAKQGKARNIFARGALEILVNASGGIPRRLNVLSHNALLSAYSEGANKVTPSIAREVVKDYQGMFRNRDGGASESPTPVSARGNVPYASAALVVASLFLLALGAAFFWVENASGRVLTHLPATVNKSYVRVVPNASNGILPIAVAGATRPTMASNPVSSLSAGARLATLPAQIQLREGDTMEKVAIQYLGSADRLDQLIEANPQIQDYDFVYAGETIHLPAVQKAAK